MNTNQRQHTSAGRRDILISRCSAEEEVFRDRRLQQTAQTCRIELENPCRFPIYFSPNIPDSLALLCNGAAQEFSVKVKPDKKR